MEKLSNRPRASFDDCRAGVVAERHQGTRGTAHGPCRPLAGILRWEPALMRRFRQFAQNWLRTTHVRPRRRLGPPDCAIRCGEEERKMALIQPDPFPRPWDYDSFSRTQHRQGWKTGSVRHGGRSTTHDEGKRNRRAQSTSSSLDRKIGPSQASLVSTKAVDKQPCRRTDRAPGATSTTQPWAAGGMPTRRRRLRRITEGAASGGVGAARGLGARGR